MRTAGRLAAASSPGSSSSSPMTAKLQDRFAPMIAKVRGMAVKGLLGRDVAFALVFFAVISLLASGTMALARVVDSALAVFLVGLVVTLALTLGAVLSGRPPKR